MTEAELLEHCQTILKSRRIQGKSVILCEGDIQAVQGRRSPQTYRRLEQVPDANFYKACIPSNWTQRIPAFFNCGGTRLMLTVKKGEDKDHKTSVIYYKVKDIHEAKKAIVKNGGNFIREPEMAAKMPDHELWIGFLRDPDDNLIGIMDEKPLS